MLTLAGEEGRRNISVDELDKIAPLPYRIEWQEMNHARSRLVAVTVWQIVEHGSLSAAARAALGLSQPALGAIVEALEQALKRMMSLFERTLNGFRPTDTALRLYEPVLPAGSRWPKAATWSAGASALNGSLRDHLEHGDVPLCACRPSSAICVSAFPQP